MSVLQLDQLFAHFVRIAVFFLDLTLDLLITLARGQGLFEFRIHLLGQFLEPLALLALHDQLLLQLLILHLHRLDDLVSLLELFFDDFQLLGVGKGIFALNDLFELLAQPGTLLDVHLDLDLDFLLARRADVLAQRLYFFVASGALKVNISNLALQVHHQVGLASPSELRLKRHTEAVLLLRHQIVDRFVLFQQLALNYVDARLQAQVLICQVVSGDLLLHHVIVEPLPLLLDYSRAHFINV